MFKEGEAIVAEKTEGTAGAAGVGAKPGVATRTVVTYPMVGALVSLERVKGIGKDRAWKPANTQQAVFLGGFFELCRSEILNIPQIDGIASKDVEVVNSFLKSRKMNIQLDPLPPDGVAAASILDLLLKWAVKGAKTTIRTSAGEVDGVSIPKKGVSFHSSNGTIVAEIATESGHQVYMAMLNTAAEGFDLVEAAENLLAGARPNHDFKGVRFPMVDLDQKPDISWMKGMHTTGEDCRPVIISQALQQTKLKMNEEGAHVKSAVAVVVMRGCSFDTKMPYVIDKPFLMVVTKDGLAKPLFVGWLAEDCWKNPGSLDM